MNSYNPPIIAGSGRSGTTWVLDALAESNHLRPIFEPLQWLGVPEAEPYANKYILENENEPGLKYLMDQILSESINCLWTKYRILPDTLHLPRSGSLRHKLGSLKANYRKLVVNYLKYHKFKSRRSIVKFIRANLMLGWLSKNYGDKILLIVRHPGAVVASKLRLGGRHWQHDPLLKRYFQDKRLAEAYKYCVAWESPQSLSPITGHTLIWCIENSLPIQQAQKSGYHIVFYEELISNPENEWKRVVDALGLSHVPDRVFLARPSEQA